MRATWWNGTGFTVATLIAAACAVAAIAVLAVVPVLPPEDGNASSLGRAWFDAGSAAALVGIAAWSRRRQEATAYTLLAVACIVASWTIGAVLDWLPTAVVSQDVGPGLTAFSVVAVGPAGFVVDLLRGLAAIPAPAAVLAIFASTPGRRLGRLMPHVLGIVVLVSVAAAIGSAWLQGASFGGPGGTIAGIPLSPLPLFLVVVVGALGSVRNEALRFVPQTAPSHRPRGLSPHLLGTVGVALTVGVVGAIGWSFAAQSVAASGFHLLPLLAALIAIVAARWSMFAAWTALAVSLAMSAGLLLSQAVEAEVAKLIAEPPTPWAPTFSWLLLAGSALALLVVGVGAAAGALRAARSAMVDRVTPAVAVITVVAMGAAAWSTVAWLVGPYSQRLPLLEGPFWLFIMTVTALAWLLAIAAIEAVRARLVPAVAEAEAVARRPLRPFRYLETVAIEALTGRAALRRSATAAERSRLASDLHAEILPSLADLAAQYEAGAPQDDVAQRLRELEREVRDLMAERRLVVLEEFGIVEAIEWLIGRAEERASMEVQLSVDDRTTTLRPPREVERAAFRIAQLAIENALQHAAPTRLELAVLARSDQVRISVADDGRGLSTADGGGGREGMGISDMRSQAADVHGDVQVVTPPTGGTTVTFAWPAA